jgi:hypothetical protein
MSHTIMDPHMKHNILLSFIISCLFVPPLFSQTITSFTPASGPVGTTVTITGANFNTTAANNIVYFGAVKASVTSAISTALVVTVPAGATYQPISVLNTGTGLMAYSSKPFLVTFTGGGYFTSTSICSGVYYYTGNFPKQPILGDMDGDGKPDLIALNRDGQSISVLRNTSTKGIIAANSFAAAVNLNTYTGNSPMSIAVGDLNADGKLDIAVVYLNSTVASVFRNTSSSGSISFAVRQDFTVTGGVEGPNALQISDLDLDGKPDIIIDTYYSNCVTVLRNTSTGGTISFAAKADFSIYGSPWSGAVSDMDGDGKPDIITLYSGGYFSILRNTSTSGTISFASYISFTTGGGYDIAAADMDGDGKPDIVTGGSNVYVTRNTSTVGSISMAAAPPYVTFSTGSGGGGGVAIDDMDGDGKPDILSNGGSGYFLRNTSTSGSITSSSFAPYVQLPGGATGGGGGNFYCFSIGDLDGDGKPDYSMPYGNGQQISVMRNALLTTPIILYPQNNVKNQPTSLTLQWRKSQEATSYHMQFGTDSTFAGGIIVNDNACADTFKTVSELSVSTLYYWRVKSKNSSDTSFFTSVNKFTTGVPSPIISSVSPASGVLGTTVTITGTDFNTTASNNVVYFGAVKANINSASSTSLTVTVPAGATCLPITVLDKITGLSGNSPAAFIPTFKGGGYVTSASIQPLVSFSVGNNPQSMALGDLNNDGKLDVVTTDQSDYTVSVLRNTSTSGSITSGSFAARQYFSVSSYPSNIVIGDVDGDGKLDLVVSVSSTCVSIFRNTSTSGNISFAAKVDFMTGTNVGMVALCDVDGDGKLDLAVSNYTDKKISFCRNGCTIGNITSNSFESRVDLSMNYPSYLAMGDLEGDAKADLVVLNANNTLSVFRNTNTAGNIVPNLFVERTDFTTGSSPSGITIGDVDSDGKPDLVVSNYSSNTVSVFRNTSTLGSITTGSFAAKVDYTTGTNPQSPVLADMDGDGKPEIAVANYGSYTVSLFRNTCTSGSISFSAKVDHSTIISNPSWKIPLVTAIGDIDGDGKPDILAGVLTYKVAVLRSAILETPVLTSPAHGVTIEQEPDTLFWNTTLDAASYRVQLGTDSTFAGGIFMDSAAITGTAKEIIGLSPNSVYYWRVSATNTGGTSPYSDVFNFTTSAALPVTLSSFEAQASSTKSEVVLHWRTATEVNNYGFEVERRKVEGRSEKVEWQKIGFIKGNGTSNTSKEYSYTDDKLSAGRYEFRLKQIDNDGSFKYSNSVEVSFMKPTEFSLSQNYPNPFNPSTTIQYSIPPSPFYEKGERGGFVTLRIFDIVGREVAVLVNETKEAGSYEVEFNASYLASGIYFYRIQAGSFRAVKKLVLTK